MCLKAMDVCCLGSRNGHRRLFVEGWTGSIGQRDKDVMARLLHV